MGLNRDLRFFWVSSIAYTNLLGKKGYVVVVVVVVIVFLWKQLRLHFAKKMCDVQQFRGSMMLIRTRIGLHSMITAGMLLLYLSYFCRSAPHDFILCFLFWSSRGLKYPYMAKRLACMVISGAANADCLNILQPARLHQGTLIEVVAA